MGKAMLLAALLAMVMAAAAPAFAQTAVGGDAVVLQYSCNQVQAALDVQYQQGEGTGAVAGAAQSLGVSQNQVLACFGTAVAAQQSTINVNTAGGGVGGGKASTATPKGGGGGGGASATASPTAAATASASATATTSAPAALPETGGASVIALGAAVLLVAGGLLVRRIVR